jgi:hypothetical protein
MKRRLLHIFWSTLWTRPSLSTDGRPLCSSSRTCVRPSLNILQHCLPVPSLITVWPYIAHNSRWNSASIINRRTHHNSLCNDKNKHEATSYSIVYKATNQVTLPRMCEVSPAPTYTYLPKINGGYFPNSSRIKLPPSFYSHWRKWSR